MGYTNAPFHTEWYHFLQNKFSPLKRHPNRTKKYLQLWPRGHAKTEGTSINYPSWLYGNDPDIHINVVSKTASLAESINMANMQRVEHDKRYIELFGELKPRNPIKWTTQQFIVDRKEISKNPTMKATGLMGPITGGRSDLIICDDIIDEENVRTRLQIEKVSTWFNKVLYPTLYPWGGILVIGTRWSYADLYAALLEKWPHSVKKAIINIKTGEVLWPEYWPLKKLLERRNEIGSTIFDCQYQNDPTGMEGSLLKAEWLRSYDTPKPYRLTWLGVDPALGEGDKHGIAVISQTHTLDRYHLREVWCQRVPFPLFLKQLKEMASTYNPAKIYIESNAFQKVLIFLPELRGLPIVPTQTLRDKESRFIAMSSHFEAERIRINPILNSQQSEFWNQWVQFPRGQYDDALDAVEIVSRNTVGHQTGFFA